MISKVIIGKTFYGACKYICKDTSRAFILETEGVREHDYRLMANDFEMQQQFRPGLKTSVFHGILSFFPGEKIEDEKMIEIAKKYLSELKIINTQYAITKHVDKDHLHLHILANLVNYNAETIKANWIGLRGKRAAQKLTKEYNLVPANQKHIILTNLENLNKQEFNRYHIYQAIEKILPYCKNLPELEKQLQKQGIETLYKYKGQTWEMQGVSFKIGEYKFKGSEVDRKFSIKNLKKTISGKMLQANNDPWIKALLPVKERVSKSPSQPAKNPQDEKSKLLEQLLKQEKNTEEMPFGFQIKKKRRPS